MSLKTYIKRGLQYILRGVPIKKITVNISYLTPSEQLKGKKIVITGGGRGLGKAMAKKFISEGGNVLITGRNEEVLKSAADELKCKYMVYDVCNAEVSEEFIRQAAEIMDGLDILVNNAGISLHEWRITNVSLEQYDAQLDTNLRGPYFLTKAYISWLESKNKKGNILFVSSERGTQTDDIPYGLSKAAINSLVKGLAPEMIKSGIRVNAIAPGITISDMTGYKIDGDLECSGNINGRVYLPDEVAEVALFLVSDNSLCVSGQIIECNEGKTGNSRYIY